MRWRLPSEEMPPDSEAWDETSITCVVTFIEKYPPLKPTIGLGYTDGYGDDLYWRVRDFLGRDRSYCEVIAWMPAPEPYKK